MNVRICDRCGDITVNNHLCRCKTPFDPVQVRRKHREAVAMARRSELVLPNVARPATAA